MNSVLQLTLPHELYEQLQELAQAENCSVDDQAIKILQNALHAQKEYILDERRKKVQKLLEELRLRCENRRKDIEWPDSTVMIREDRDR